MITIKELAKKLNLSSATVSRALRNDETLSISTETRIRILAAVDETGYIRNQKGIDKKKQTLLIIHKYQTFRNQIDSSYYFAIRSGIETACSKACVQCTFMAIEDIQNITSNFDGVILVGNYACSQFEYIFSVFKNIPVTVIGIVAYFSNKIDHVSHNNFDSVSLALNYLFEMGHQKIGYLGIEEALGTDTIGSRKSSFIKIMEKCNILELQWIHEVDHGKDRVDQGYKLMTSILQSKIPLPTAYFCANDPVALGVIKALVDNNIQIPKDISIVAHDGCFPTQYSSPSLTTVDVHPFQLGVEGVCMILQKITGKFSFSRKLLIYPELLVRDSVKKI